MIAFRAVLSCWTTLLCVACGEADLDDGGVPVSMSRMEPGGDSAALRARAALSLEAIDAAALPDESTARARSELGRALFFEKRLSTDAQVSCGTCHMREFGGGDGLSLPVGSQGRINPRNAPSVFNVSLQSAQHWRGDRTSLADQAARAPLGMASFGNRDEAEALGRLRDAGYEERFGQVFPDDDPALTLANLGLAIAAYEQTLTTPARFDAFLKGDDDALDAPERAGLRVFLDTGCADCHDGPGLGGGQLTKFGVFAPYELATGSEQVDQGRFDVTQAESDRFVFKVPMLRNVTETAPYFHDGQVIGLEQAVRVMLAVQLDTELLDYELANLVAFLGALSGEAPDWFAPP